jgi:hypothetical protein
VILFWIWIGATLFPADALLYYQDKPAAFEFAGTRSIGGTGATLNPVPMPQAAHIAERAV